MRRALELAALGAEKVAPNPMVGCVVVLPNESSKQGEIIGEGYHQAYGGPHAEVNAIANVADKELLKKSTLYVTLEPCAHQGKTPPCADLICRMHVARVVIAMRDPNPLVAGKGIAKLKSVGIEVVEGVLEKEANWLNRRFLTFMSQKRPYIILKWAQSLDRFMADSTGEPVWISNEYSQQLVHQWRAEEAAIMIGTHTALLDNPSLTTRHWPGSHPMRVVLDKDCVVPISNKIFSSEAQTLVITQKEEKEGGNTAWRRIPFKQSLAESLELLHGLGISSLIIEGGPTLLSNALQHGLWDEARVFVGTMTMEKGLKAPEIGQCYQYRTRIGSDTLKHFVNQSTQYVL